MTNKSAQRRGGRGGAAYLEGILETVGDVAGGGADHDGASLDGLCDGKGGSRQSRGRRGDGDQARRLGARRRSRPAMELEKKAAEAHLRGDGGARDAGPGGGNTRDGGDNAEGGHGGGHFDVKCGGLRDPCGTLWVARGSDLPVTEPSPASGWVGFSDKLSSPAHSCVTFPTVVLRLSWTGN